MRSTSTKSVRPLALDQWARKRPPLIAMYAHQVAMSAESIFKLCSDARAQLTILKEHAEAPPAWCYTDSDRVTASATRILADDEVLRAFNNSFDALSAAAPGDKNLTNVRLAAYMNEVHESICGLYRIHLRELRSEIAGGTKPDSGFKDRIRQPEILFFFRVVLPCWLEYRIDFYALLAAATTDGLKSEPQIAAMEKLLRIDTYCLNYSPVSKIYTDAIASKNKPLKRRLQDAHAGEPLKNLTPRNVKIALGSLIMKGALALEKQSTGILPILQKWKIRIKRGKVRITAPDIARLYHAVARDTGNGDQDPDFLDTEPHSDYMALQRDMKLWQDFENLT